MFCLFLELTLDTSAGANLVLPLGGHDLGVDTGDVDAGIQASAVVSLDDVTAVDLAGADTAVVGTLGTGETVLGPAIGPVVAVKESVLLLQAEPKFLLGVCLHQSSSLMAIVILVGSAIRVPGLAENEDVVTETEGVRVDGDRAQVDVGVVTGSLTGR